MPVLPMQLSSKLLAALGGAEVQRFSRMLERHRDSFGYVRPAHRIAKQLLRSGSGAGCGARARIARTHVRRTHEPPKQLASQPRGENEPREKSNHAE